MRDSCIRDEFTRHIRPITRRPMPPAHCKMLSTINEDAASSQVEDREATVLESADVQRSNCDIKTNRIHRVRPTIYRRSGIISNSTAFTLLAACQPHKPQLPSLVPRAVVPALPFPLHSKLVMLAEPARQIVEVVSAFDQRCSNPQPEPN